MKLANLRLPDAKRPVSDGVVTDPLRPIVALVQDEGTDEKKASSAFSSDLTYLAILPLLQTWMQQFGMTASLESDIVAMAAHAENLAELIVAAKEALTDTGDLTSFLYPADTPLAAPIPRPNRILAIGRNYAEHAREQSNPVPEEPIVFLKASTSVIGPGQAIEIPEWLGRVDYEAELLVVIGKGGKNIAEADAMAHVTGYSVFNDVTARTQQKADQEKKQPWFRSKSFDTSGPLGPYLVTADEIADPHDLRITLSVNGELRQNDTTGSLSHRIPALIAYLSKWFALEPGDVIATGTPPGVGALTPGDTVTASVEGIGNLTNPVIAI